MAEVLQIYDEDANVGFLRIFEVGGFLDGERRWVHDVAAKDEEHACELAREFILTADGLDELRGMKLEFTAERSRHLREPYGWVIGVRR